MASKPPQTAAEILAAVAAELNWNILIDDITSHLGNVAGDAARRAIQALQERGDLPKESAAVAGIFEDVDAAGLDYAKNRAAELVGMRVIRDETGAITSIIPNPNPEWAITETTRDTLRDLVTKAIDEGWAAGKLREEIKDNYAFSNSRALMISRSEIDMAHAKGQHNGMLASGVMEAKEWNAAPDCCDDCKELDGEIVPIDEPFSTGDDVAYAHPNCRCSTLYHKTMEDAEKAAKDRMAKADFDESQHPRDEHGRFTDAGVTPPEPGMRMADMTDVQRAKEQARLKAVHDKQRQARDDAKYERQEREAAQQRDDAHLRTMDELRGKLTQAKNEATDRTRNDPQGPHVLDDPAVRTAQQELNQYRVMQVWDMTAHRDTEGENKGYHAPSPTTARDYYARSLQDSVRQMPEALRNDIALKGVTVVAAHSVEDFNPAMGHGYGGYFASSAGQIVIGKYSGPDSSTPFSMATRLDVLYHETGHCIDVARSEGRDVVDNTPGKAAGEGFLGKTTDESNQPDYARAYSDDMAQLDSQSKERYGYYVDPQYPGEPSRTSGARGDGYGAHRAREETFAQVFSDTMRNHLGLLNSGFSNLADKMPRTRAVVERVAKDRGYIPQDSRYKEGHERT